MIRQIVPPGGWRQPAAYAGIAAGGRAALAWEVLRRDPRYDQMSQLVEQQVGQAAPDAFVVRWGLHFRA